MQNARANQSTSHCRTPCKCIKVALRRQHIQGGVLCVEANLIALELPGETVFPKGISSISSLETLVSRMEEP